MNVIENECRSPAEDRVHTLGSSRHIEALGFDFNWPLSLPTHSRWATVNRPHHPPTSLSPPTVIYRNAYVLFRICVYDLFRAALFCEPINIRWTPDDVKQNNIRNMRNSQLRTVQQNIPYCSDVSNYDRLNNACTTKFPPKTSILMAIFAISGPDFVRND